MIESIVTGMLFLNSALWVSSNEVLPGEEFPAAMIRGATSKSLVKRNGPLATRTIYWPRDRKTRLPVLGKIHIGLIRDGNGNMVSVEVLAKNDRGEVEPFLYEWHENGWKRAYSFGRNRPVAQVCFQCHQTPSDEMEAMSFKPFFLSNEKELRATGYRSPYVMSQLLRL